MSDRSYRRRLRLASCATAFFLLLITILSIASLGNTAPRPENEGSTPPGVEGLDKAPVNGSETPGVPGEVERIRLPGEGTWFAFMGSWAIIPGAK